MSSQHGSGEKAPKDEAEKQLAIHVAGVCDVRYAIVFENDDGGAVLNLYIEVSEPSEPIDPFLREVLPTHVWMGWRFVVTKCPPDYIDAVLKVKKSDDY